MFKPYNREVLCSNLMMMMIILLSLLLLLLLYSPLLVLGRFFSFLILYTSGRSPWTGDQPVANSHWLTKTKLHGLSPRAN
jgi:hypothetical protein